MNLQGDEEDGESLWGYLPHPALYKIFQLLSYKDLVRAGLVCKRWLETSRDDLLWRDLFYECYMVDKSVPVMTGRLWYEEFKRLCHRIPVVQTEILEEHHHQVLHVSFSHDGRYFATCSKDGSVIIWNSNYPATIKYSKNMKLFKWKYTQYSQFNESDTLLLVSGVHFGTTHSTSGEIAVFNLDGFYLQCRVVNKPYDIFGTWYSDQWLLSGDLHWLAHLISSSHLWLNRASQEVDSELVPVTHGLFRFYNQNASSIRAIAIANCLPGSEKVDIVANGEGADEDESEGEGGDKGVIFEHGNPVSHRDITNQPCSSSSCSSKSDDEVPIMDPTRPTSGGQFANPIWYNSDYRKVEMERRGRTARGAVDDDDSDFEMDDNRDEGFDDQDDADRSTTSSDTDADVLLEDKYLIFTTGSKTYTPHQLGFKRIKPFAFPKRLDPGPTLKERLRLQEERRDAAAAAREPDWLDFDRIADKFDQIDHVIDLHGHIIGMGLSPDHRYLYVNSRSWPENYVITNPLDPPPIAQEIDVHVIDLVTLKRVGTMLRAHKAYTPNNDCFFIFLDVSDEYVASGAEDRHGYVWDRHYGVCLAKYPHQDVVNSVAFNPADPEMLVTTSDDHKIKIWRSRKTTKTLGLDARQLPAAVELRHHAAQKKGRKPPGATYHHYNR